MFNAHMARKYGTQNGRGLVTKKYALGVGTMQNRVECQYTIPDPSRPLPPRIQLTGALNGIIAFWHIKSWSLLATMLQTDPGCQPGPRPRVGILEFCAPPQIFKTVFKELESDFSDAIKLM